MADLNLIGGNPGSLDFNATELKKLTGWPAPVIEDYLNQTRQLNLVVQVIDVDFGSMALQDANNVNITGGQLNGISIGNIDPASNIVTEDLTVNGTANIQHAVIENAEIHNIIIDDIVLEDLTVNGNTILGDEASDSLTIAPEIIGWQNDPTHLGNHTFVGDVTINGFFHSRGITDDATEEQIEITDSLVDIHQDAAIGPTADYPWVGFNGTDTSLVRGGALTGVSNTKVGTLVCRIRVKDIGAARDILVSTANRFAFTKTSDNEIRVFIYNPSNANRVSLLSSTQFTDPDQWLDIFAYWDTGNAVSGMYINDVSDISTNFTSDSVLEYSGNNWYFAVSTNLTNETEMDCAFFWLDLSQCIDGSDESNRRLFFLPNGEPADLGDNGENPTGTSPIIYFAGDADSFPANKGTGEGFTLNGALVNGGDPVGQLNYTRYGIYTDDATNGPQGQQTLNTKGYYQDGIYVPTISSTSTLTNKTISVDDNDISGIAASSFVLSDASGNIDGSATQKVIPSGAVVGTTDTQTLSGKTIDGDDNTLTDIATTSLKDRTGSDTDVVTGTAGTSGNFASWNADGDAVDSGSSSASFATAAQGNLADSALQPGDDVSGSNITVGSGKTLDVSAGTLTLAANQISGNAIDGGTISNFASTGIDDNANANAITIDLAERVILGHTVAISTVGTPSLQLHGISFSTATMGFVRWENAGGGPSFTFSKSRGATPGTNVIVQANDNAGTLQFTGDDGTDLASVAGSISCSIDGIPGVNDMPGRLTLSTTPGGSATATERIRINSGGTVNILNATKMGGTAGDAPTISGTGYLDMDADTFRLRTSRTPASAGATGNAGEYCWDADYIYICVATNTWKRVAITTWP